MNTTNGLTDKNGEPGDAAEAGDPDEPPSLWRRLRVLRDERRRRRNFHRSLSDALRFMPGSQLLPLDESEQVIFRNLVFGKNRAVEEHMIPRAEIVALDIGASRAEALRVIRECGHSRLPVYRGSLDSVLGFLHVKDLLRETGINHGGGGDGDSDGAGKGDSDGDSDGAENSDADGVENSDGDMDLASLLRPVIFASPSVKNFNLLRTMRLRRTHLALVVDEFGGVDGLITIEDLVEELVGEIEDEHDAGVRQPRWERLSDGSFRVDARVRTDALPAGLRSAVGSEAESEDIDTLGGFVAWLAGCVPGAGELIRHEVSGWEFVVLRANPRRIISLTARPP
ncbi:MAG: CBS domain-containing protein, partial [Alphaproteobacteria bacterium]|nr:CBS domain-containing protein [Alphaproteobacteria bacterium]